MTDYSELPANQNIILKFIRIVIRIVSLRLLYFSYLNRSKIKLTCAIKKKFNKNLKEGNRR